MVGAGLPARPAACFALFDGVRGRLCDGKLSTARKNQNQEQFLANCDSSKFPNGGGFRSHILIFRYFPVTMGRRFPIFTFLFSWGVLQHLVLEDASSQGARSSLHAFEAEHARIYFMIKCQHLIDIAMVSM